LYEHDQQAAFRSVNRDDYLGLARRDIDRIAQDTTVGSNLTDVEPAVADDERQSDIGGIASSEVSHGQARLEQRRRILDYAEHNALALGREVGFGVHGSVVETLRNTAAKGFEDRSAYVRERNAFLRLRRHGVWTISACQVPRLIDFDDDLWVIEMTLVSPPFVLDFGGAYLDQRPDYSEETLAEWEAERSELFARRLAARAGGSRGAGWFRHLLL
jgi:hypothetical protein